MRLLILTAALATSVAPTAAARQWTSTDGRVIEADFVSRQNNSVVLKLKDGREVPVELEKLSAEDQEFAKNQAPSAPATGAGKKTPGFNDVNLDKKAWVMRPQPETFGITGMVLSQQLETPHFLVTAGPKMKPALMQVHAESCERLYTQISRDLPGLDEKFMDRKMTVWLAVDKEELALMGKCLQGLDVRCQSWGEFTIVSASFPSDLADAKKILSRARGFNTSYEATDQRNILWPKRIHFMAATMISTYGHNEYQMQGRSFGMFNLSYSYFLEYDISGKVETKVKFTNAAANVEGFKNPRGWAVAVKRILSNTPLKPGLQRFLTLDPSEAEPMDVGAGFGLMQFIFRDPGRLAGINKVLENARKEQTPPTAAEFAATMGFASVEEFDRQWLEFLKSDQFK